MNEEQAAALGAAILDGGDDEVRLAMHSVLEAAAIIARLVVLSELPGDVLELVVEATRADEDAYRESGLWNPEQTPKVMRFSHAIADLLEGK
jgi:hypothetical protein